MGEEGRQTAKEREQAMIYKRGKNGIYSYRFRFAGRMIHESARTRSKTLAREAERQRRRELEERINNVKKRGLRPRLNGSHASGRRIEHIKWPAIHRALPGSHSSTYSLSLGQSCSATSRLKTSRSTNKSGCNPALKDAP